MDKVSYVGNGDINAIEFLYNQYRKDPESVDEGWKKFFEGFEFAKTNYDEESVIPENFQKEFRVINLINGYRTRGHLFTKTNPALEKHSSTCSCIHPLLFRKSTKSASENRGDFNRRNQNHRQHRVQKTTRKHQIHS